MEWEKFSGCWQAGNHFYELGESQDVRNYI